MLFDIDDFRSQTSSDGAPILVPHFQVRITPGQNTSIKTDTRFLSFYIMATNLPGLAYESMEILRHGYGIKEFRPVGIFFNQIKLNVIVDGKTNTIDFFQKWFESVSSIRTESPDGGYGLFKYPEQYEMTMDITVYDTTGKEIAIYKMENVWPSTVEDTSMTWDGQNTILVLPITLTYKKYTITKKD